MSLITALTGLAKSALPAATADGEEVNILADLQGRIRLAYENTAQNALRVLEVSPLSTHHNEETLADLENIASGTTGYLYIDLDGFQAFSLHLEVVSPAPDTCTVTVEGTNQDDGTAAASISDWIDVTNVLFGSASTTADSFWLGDTKLAFKYLRIKYVTAGGVGNSDLTVYVKKMY